MYSSTPSLTSSLYGGGWSTPRPSCFAPGSDPEASVQEAGLVTGPVRIGAEKFYPTGIRFPDGPARSESLY
jgi:hypothetical protein